MLDALWNDEHFAGTDLHGPISKVDAQSAFDHNERRSIVFCARCLESKARSAAGIILPLGRYCAFRTYAPCQVLLRFFFENAALQIGGSLAQIA